MVHDALVYSTVKAAARPPHSKMTYWPMESSSKNAGDRFRHFILGVCSAPAMTVEYGGLAAALRCNGKRCLERIVAVPSSTPRKREQGSRTPNYFGSRSRCLVARWVIMVLLNIHFLLYWLGKKLRPKAGDCSRFFYFRALFCGLRGFCRGTTPSCPVLPNTSAEFILRARPPSGGQLARPRRLS